MRDYARAWLVFLVLHGFASSSPIPLPSHRVDSECRQLCSTCIGKAGDGKYGHPSVRLTQRNSNLPPENRRGRGRGVVWRAYKWPRKGDALSSGRCRNDQIIEVFCIPLAYIIVAPLAFVFWLIQSAHRIKRSQPTNKSAILISCRAPPATDSNVCNWFIEGEWLSVLIAVTLQRRIRKTHSRKG